MCNCTKLFIHCIMHSMYGILNQRMFCELIICYHIGHLKIHKQLELRKVYKHVITVGLDVV
jgi:hypothetical protein